jgi:hypothetical protein
LMEVYPFASMICSSQGNNMLDIQNSGPMGANAWGGGFQPTMTLGLTF